MQETNGTGAAANAKVLSIVPSEAEIDEVTAREADAARARLTDAVTSAKLRVERQQAFLKAAEKQLADAHAALAAEGA